MDRINTENTISTNGKRLFKDGDPTGDIPEQPTAVNADWLNGVQEEICNVIEKSGANLSKEDNGQLARAVEKMIDKRIEEETNTLKSFFDTKLNTLESRFIESRKETEKIKQQQVEAQKHIEEVDSYANHALYTLRLLKREHIPMHNTWKRGPYAFVVKKERGDEPLSKVMEDHGFVAALEGVGDEVVGWAKPITGDPLRW